MPDPTPAPALTDEQIDELTETVRADFVASAADEDEIRADHETFARWYAAVVARAKRDERERIAARAKAIQCAATGDFGDGWNAALRAVIETGEPAATPRQIGVRFVGGPWDGQSVATERVTAPVFAPGHQIGNHYWLNTKSDPPTYHWDRTEYETEEATR